MIEGFLRKEKNDSEALERSFRVPGKQKSGLYFRKYTIKMPKYYWRLLDWMHEKHGMGASFIFHHCDVIEFNKWDKISEFFMFFIDDWVAWESSARRAFNLTVDLAPSKVPE